MVLPSYLSEYLPILIFLGVAVGLSFIMVVIPFIVALRRPDKEKLSQYECGFEAFSDARGKFDVRFYLVAILFIIFDSPLYGLFEGFLKSNISYCIFINLHPLICFESDSYYFIQK